MVRMVYGRSQSASFSQWCTRAPRPLLLLSSVAPFVYRMPAAQYIGHLGARPLLLGCSARTDKLLCVWVSHATRTCRKAPEGRAVVVGCGDCLRGLQEAVPRVQRESIDCCCLHRRTTSGLTDLSHRPIGVVGCARRWHALAGAADTYDVVLGTLRGIAPKAFNLISLLNPTARRIKSQPNFSALSSSLPLKVRGGKN
eukprot:scaffold14634_cov112-Isochrysis_galbana.AAC.1